MADAFERIKQTATAAVRGLSEEQLIYRPAEDANSIAWLVWHLTRIQDDHIAELAGQEQQWLRTWADKFKLPFDKSATGYGQSSADVAKVRASAMNLQGYLEAVHVQTLDFLKTLREKDYERVVDTNWDPPVTLAVRLVSVINDDMQHAGQAAYVRGLIS